MPKPIDVKCHICGKPAYIITRELCQSCYDKLRRKGPLEKLEKRERRHIPCTAEGCENTITLSNKSGYCGKCYRKIIYVPQNQKNEKLMHRRSLLKLKFALTNEEYNQMLEDQNFSCAICHKHQSEDKKHFAVDHNHKTNKIRGLLCYHCNNGIGHFEEDIERIKQAKEYLKKAKEENETNTR